GLTRTRGVVGTYEYMSPEQIQGGEISPATDVYAVGIMAFELLTGRVPFPQASDSGLDTMKAHLESPVPDLRALRPDCPARLAQVVGRALSKLPAQRFADAGEMLAALEAAAALTRKETQKESEVRPRMESGTPGASPPSGLSDRSIGKEPLPVLAPTMTADLERGSGVAGHPLEALPEPYVSSPLPPQRGRIGWWAAGAVVLVVVGLVVGPKIFRSGQDATPATEAESLREKEADRVFAEARKAVEKAEKARKAAQLAAMGTAVEPLQYAEPAEVPKEDIVSPAAPDEPPPDVAAGAREAVETAFKALTAKDVSPLFGLLPDSYVADIDDVVQTFARGMDKELWNKVMNLLDRSIALLARNKTAFAGMLLEFGVPVSAEDVGRALDATVEAWDLLEKAGITDLERLKSFSTRRFAADTLPKVAALVFKLADNTQQKAQVDAALAILAAATVKAESSGERDEKFGEIVTVAVNITGDEESEVFVQVDGKWVPLGLARDWDEGMAEARKAIAEMTTELPTAAPAAMAQLAQIETVLAQMEQTGDLSLLRSMAEGFAQGMATESAPAQ
ncbi:MAG: hypothetical protein FJ109_21520, partial [Deltaproteobacteria bacterium]|nr:hypothetical protein [Deltaproteobacteria bacterium]